MNKKEKIKWYEEIIKTDPSSKFYFQLAKLYAEENLIDKAISMLRFGLEKHPEDLEARLLLSELLIKTEGMKEAEPELKVIDSVLRKYPLFWKGWAYFLNQNDQKDLSTAVLFLGACFDGNKASWSDILTAGIKSLFSDETHTEDETSNQEVYKKSSGDENFWFKTKTMAELLEKQGEYEEALRIYKELLSKSQTEKEKKLIRQKIENLESLLQASLREENEKIKKKQIIKLLEKLLSKFQRKMDLLYETV